MSRKAPAGFGRGVPEKDREAPRRYPTSAADPALKEQAIARTAPLGTKLGRYQPSDTLLAFLENL